MRKFLVLLAACAVLCAISLAQDSQSLGDVARQNRQKKQQTQTATKQVATNDDASNGSDTAQPKAPHVVTNEEIPEQPEQSTTKKSPAYRDTQESPGNREAQGGRWKSQIQSQKNAIAALQKEVDILSKSIRYAGGNCVANCAQWNERQQQKQAEVESMKAQLEEQQKRLEEMQETARRQGFGSAIYDP